MAHFLIRFLRRLIKILIYYFTININNIQKVKKKLALFNRMFGYVLYTTIMVDD